MKPMMDDALPAGNAVAAVALTRLGHLLGEPRYLAAAEGTVRAAWDGLKQYPHAHTALLDALEELLYPPQTIVIRGEPAQTAAWIERAQRDYAPRRLSVSIAPGEADLPGLLAVREPRAEVTTYLCHGHECEAPMQDFVRFQAALEMGEVPRQAR